MKYFLGLAFFIGFNQYLHAQSNHASSINVLIELKPVNASQEILTGYKKLLGDVFDRNVEFSSDVDQIAHIIITNASTISPRKNWLKSEYTLDTIPSFSITQRVETHKTAIKSLGSVIRPFMHQRSSGNYLFDNMDEALLSLKNKRIEAILDYTKESSYYVFDNPTIVKKRVFASQEIQIYFNNPSMASKFDSFMGLMQGTQGNIQSLPQKNTDFVILIQIPKQFDVKTNQLSVTTADLITTKWLRENVPTSVIQTEQANINQAFERLSQAENVCVLNTSKGEKREKVAIFSLPTYVYLDYRLYVKKGSSAETSIQGWMPHHERLILSDFFAENKKGLIGYFDYMSRTSAFSEHIEPLILSNINRFSQLEANATNRSLRMLDLGRLDYLIAYPSVLEKYLSSSTYASEFQSYSFKFYEEFTPVFVSCSQSKQGQRFISRLNDLLEDEEIRDELVSLLVENMLFTDGQSMLRIFDILYPGDNVSESP